MRVLALDPGQRVGWARAVVRPMRPSRGYVAESDVLPSPSLRPMELRVEDHGIAALRDAALAVHKAIVLEDRIDVVVLEKFILTARGAKVLVGDDLQTSQFIGLVRLCCWLNPRVKLVMQPARRDRPYRRSLNCDHPAARDILARLEKLPKSHDDSHDGSALQHLWDWFFERYV